MKNHRQLFLTMVFLCGAIIIASSCRKNKLNKQTITEEDYFMAETSFNEIFKTISEVAVQIKGINITTVPLPEYSFNINCTTITLKDSALLPVDTTNSAATAAFPKTLTIDFGSGCTGDDGITRKGKISATFTGKIWDSATVIILTPQDFYWNERLVEGTQTINNIGKSASTSIIETTGKITYPDVEEITWESTCTRKRTTANNTDLFKNVFSFDGSSRGTNRQGRNFTVNITTLLRLQFCDFKPEITKGKIEIQPEGLKLKILDYGDGTCDNEVKVTVANKTKTLPLRQ